MTKKIPIPQRRKRHIASIDFGKFYRPAFTSLKESKAFVARVNGAPKDRTKVLLHQAGRMVWLADQIDKVAYGRPALQIMFYMIAAEAAAKLFYEFGAEGRSRLHVHKFFADLCGPEQHQTLARAFWHPYSGKPLTLTETVDLLYDIRCDVAHRGRYYQIHLPDPGQEQADHFLLDWKDGLAIARISVQDLRRTVLQGAVLACRKLLPVISDSA